VLPNDIGDIPVVIQIKSLLYATSVSLVNINFKVMVKCEVSSMTITGPGDFTYTLGEGIVFKGPF
jgi:hypothetical protein